MSRSFIHLRRALFGTSCAIVFGFGTSQALAAPSDPITLEACSLSEKRDCENACLAASGGETGMLRCYKVNGGNYTCECGGI